MQIYLSQFSLSISILEQLVSLFKKKIQNLLLYQDLGFSQEESEHDLVATTIKACFINIPNKEFERDLEAAIHKARFTKNSWIQVKKEVNKTWWQTPLSLDSWKHVQSWLLILQWKQTLTQERNQRERNQELTFTSSSRYLSENPCIM